MADGSSLSLPSIATHWLAWKLFVSDAQAAVNAGIPAYEQALKGAMETATDGLRKQVQEHEAAVAKLTADKSAIDLAMFDPKQAEPALAKLAMSDLMKRRADVAAALEAAEVKWMEASERLETAG